MHYIFFYENSAATKDLLQCITVQQIKSVKIMEERVAPSLRKTALQILSEKTTIMSSIKSLFAVFFSLSKTPFLKPNTNIQHKNNLIKVESTYLVQPIDNAKKLQLHFTDTSQTTGFH